MAWVGRVAFLAVGLISGLLHGAASPEFYRDVLPILQQRCQSCHRPGEIGPMPLLTYQQTRPYARAIREAVRLKTMPPWYADPRFGHFANDPSLSAAEIETLSQWAAANAPAGDLHDAPVPKRWQPGWNIPTPATVYSMPRPFALPASGDVDYQLVVIPTGLTEDRWVQSVEVRPSDRRVVHHAVVYLREPDSAWLREAQSGVPYSPSASLDLADRRRLTQTTSDILAIYTPGSPPVQLPAGRGKLIKAGSDLVLQLHYTTIGQRTQDQTRIGVIFADVPPAERVLTLQMGNDRFVIPPGHPDFEVHVSGTLPNDAVMLSMFPHMHLRGRAFIYEMQLPGQPRETLLRVDPYSFNWQLTYQLAEPLRLPAGTKLTWTATFDNSRRNLRNPDPEAAVHFGEQSWEEMMIGFFDVAVPAAVDKPAFFQRGASR